MTLKRRFFRDPGNGEGGGLPPSISDLEKAAAAPAKPVPPQPPAGGPPEPPATPPEEGRNEDGTIAEGYVEHEGKPMKQEDFDKLDTGDGDDGSEEPITEEEALDDKGELKEGYIKNEDGTYSIDPEYEVVPDEKEEADKYYKDVATHSGIEVDVDFGDVDPLSAEGAALRDKAVYSKAQEDLDAYLKNNNPRAYAYMLHTDLGGTEEEFFAQNNTPTLPPRESFEESADIQSNWLKKDLISKGVPESVADNTIKAWVKENVLKEKAVAWYNEQEQNHKTHLENLQQQSDQNRKQYDASVNQVINVVDSTINSKDLKIAIPEKDKAKFKEYVVQHLGYDNQQFFVTQQLTDENVPTLLEGLYLQFSGGDLSKIVKKESAKKTLKTLRRRVASDQATQKRGARTPSSSTKNLPLSAF